MNQQAVIDAVAAYLEDQPRLLAGLAGLSLEPAKPAAKKPVEPLPVKPAAKKPVDAEPAKPAEPAVTKTEPKEPAESKRPGPVLYVQAPPKEAPVDKYYSEYDYTIDTSSTRITGEFTYDGQTFMRMNPADADIMLVKVKMDPSQTLKNYGAIVRTMHYKSQGRIRESIKIYMQEHVSHYSLYAIGDSNDASLNYEQGGFNDIIDGRSPLYVKDSAYEVCREGNEKIGSHALVYDGRYTQYCIYVDPDQITIRSPVTDDPEIIMKIPPSLHEIFKTRKLYATSWTSDMKYVSIKAAGQYGLITSHWFKSDDASSLPENMPQDVVFCGKEAWVPRKGGIRVFAANGKTDRIVYNVNCMVDMPLKGKGEYIRIVPKTD